MLIDEDMIEKLDEEIYGGPPTSSGEWGSYVVGGERLRSREVERKAKSFNDKEYYNTSFCLEKLEDLYQAKQWGTAYKHTQWRDLDYQSLKCHQDRLLEWIGQYKGQSRPGYAQILPLPRSWELSTYYKAQGPPSLDVLNTYEIPFVEHITILNWERGAWQRPWPKCSEQCLFAVRSHEWGEKMLQWPDSQTLTGPSQKDLSRICDLLKALENHYLEAAVVYAPLRWETSVEKSRTDFYKDQKRKISEAQAGLFRTWTPDQAVPLFDLRRAAGDPGTWNYLQPTERTGRYQQFTPLIP